MSNRKRVADKIRMAVSLLHSVARRLLRAESRLGSDPLLALAARHRDLWKGVDADEYVRQLREGSE
jgi:hypothetical protein